MKRNDNAGPVLAGLAIVIVVCLVDLTRQGQPYMVWADIMLGFVAVGLFLLELFQARGPLHDSHDNLLSVLPNC